MFEKPFTKDNLDQYLKELAKEFRKLNGKGMPADIILIGGASVVINYGFRDMTYDMDAIINAASSMPCIRIALICSFCVSVICFHLLSSEVMWFLVSTRAPPRPQSQNAVKC